MRPPQPAAVGGSRAFALLLVLAGAAGLSASWVITLDEFKLLEDPGFTPGCSLNPVLSCGSVMQSDQASVFGFPNPMLGLVAYGMVVCVGMSLLAGAAFPRWYWLTFTAGCLFGVGFVSWLQFESLYRINALCLWCCLAWIATILAFWYAVSFDVRHRLLPAPAGVRTFFAEFTWVLPLLHIGAIGMLILTRWWSFWTG
ncbi:MULTISPECIES: vitamin K epoxide reductase family protein [unclassified Streptomyces]|uniref:vitamin K epoxide reductase family protein n=1 Tax=unclassified Streptomyces TaxID=2593676 RepID=UPI0029B8A35E|nr:vitamin K epoxide reductase family protein [Streptomyces sp. FL07-04A]MDX3577433.1 vitamin K epoxide reductase family protein [Streptomyces sp. FL07-04A]